MNKLIYVKLSKRSIIMIDKGVDYLGSNLTSLMQQDQTINDRLAQFVFLIRYWADLRVTDEVYAQAAGRQV